MNAPESILLRIYLHRPDGLQRVFLENIKRMEGPSEEVLDPAEADIIVVSNPHRVGEIWRETVFIAVVGHTEPRCHVQNVAFISDHESSEKFVKLVRNLLSLHVYS